MMKLYHRPDCPFCWKVRIFLLEAKIDVEEVIIALGSKHPDVIALSPNHTVPILVDGDLVIWESAVIVEYLVDKFPRISLMKGTAEQRAKIRQLHSFSDKNIGKILFPYIKQVRESDNQRASDELERNTSEAWRALQKDLSKQLGTGDFFGADFSVAECALIPRFALANLYGLTLEDEFHNLKKWFTRCMERPSFTGSLPKYLPGINEMINKNILVI